MMAILSMEMAAMRTVLSSWGLTVLVAILLLPLPATRSVVMASSSMPPVTTTTPSMVMAVLLVVRSNPTMLVSMVQILHHLYVLSIVAMVLF